MTPGWQAKARAAARPWHLDIVSQIAQDVRGNIVADGTIRTGAMLASVRQEGQRVLIGTDHWHFIEYGTRPHVITPNTKQALSWPDARHPTKRVNHPGTKEYAPMRRALYKKRG